jgi:4-amino-4-deoxy-L-arabinose transferase-like glycosyltransferase
VQIIPWVKQILLKVKESMVADKRSTIFVGLALLIGGVLRCWNIDQSFWWDEIWSTMTYAKAQSLWDVVSGLGYYFNNHILYSLIARAFIAVLGESELVARLPAVLMGLLAIVVLFQFGKAFLGIPAGSLASLLLAFSAFHIDHSSEARGYSGLVLFSILSSYYFIKGLKENQFTSWMAYVFFTVLGFYSHVFMFAVSVSQFFSSLIFVGGRKWASCKIEITQRALRSFFLALLCAGITTLLIYSPVLPAFFRNLGRMQVVTVSRVPFMVSLVQSLFPGCNSSAGGVVYGILFVVGLYCILKKDPTLFLYFLVLCMLPLSLYLVINPMFVFERYFIFTLPAVLLIVSQGIMGLTTRLRGIYKNGVIVVSLALLVFLQVPAIGTIVSQDRQNYREAIRYVEGEMSDETKDLIFSIGYAGEHFQYYASDSTIVTPETLDELSALMQGKDRLWCLITAWLPDIRPPYEDRSLYAETPEQTNLYNYVKKHFVLKKTFFSTYLVEVYLLER